MIRTVSRLLLGVLLGALVLAACGNGGFTSKPTVASGGTITQRLLGDWQVMDPQISAENQGSQLTMAAYDRLLAFGRDQKLVPYVAKSWKSTATSANFTVRNDVVCADGSKLTPTAIGNSFKRLFDPKTNTNSPGQYFGTGPNSVTADDAAGTVSFSFGSPCSPLIYPALATAEHLRAAQRSCWRRRTTRPPPSPFSDRAFALPRMQATGRFQVRVRVALEEITPSSVRLRSLDTDQAETLAADLVVLMTAFESQTELYDQLVAAGVNCELVGDALVPRSMQHAIATGHRAGMAV